MKKIFLVIISAMSLASCSLDMRPDSELTYDSFWNSEEAVKANHVGIYARLRDYNNGLWRLGELRSDVWGGKTFEQANDQAWYLNDISATKVPVGNWGNFYGMIHYLNDFITNAPKITASNAQQRNHMMGQIHGLRAYIYFTMLKTWGDVPIATEPIKGVTDLSVLNKARAPKAEVAKFIKEDIEKSLEYFGTDNTLFNNRNVYWSKAATLTLKGEAYLFFGTVLGEGTAAYQTSKDALSAVTGFSLAPTYAGLWGTSNENNKEFIFAFDYQQNQAQSFYQSVTGAIQVNHVDPTFDRTGKSMKGFLAIGNNRYGPSNKLLSLMHADLNDTRLDNTFTLLYSDNNAGTGYATFNDSKYKASLLKKFYGEVVDGIRQSYANIPVYRYADVLLMLAEAKNQLGESPAAEINQVRNRAYGGKAPLFVSGSKDSNTKAILDERLKEFVGEGKRWWDLQRAGSKWVFSEVETMNASPISGDPRKIYFPITQGMIDLDPNLKQTEGY